MYNSNLLYSHKAINSVIDDGSNLIDSFNRVLCYYDPNKKANFRSMVLDCSYSFMIPEKESRLYNINKTKNLTGYVIGKKYDIIIYEPPKNKNFYQDVLYSSKIFSNLLKPQGVLIVKTNDFKDKNSNKLQGSFELWDIFSDAGLYLFDNIVYNFNKPSIPKEVYDRAEIIHMYFMIFKKKQGDENEV